MNRSLKKLQNRTKEQETKTKKALAAEFTLSVNDIKDEVEPWIEVVGNREYEFKKIENITDFGVINLLFKEKNEFNNGKEIKLSFVLKL